jgi:hypothetical protein
MGTISKKENGAKNEVNIKKERKKKHIQVQLSVMGLTLEKEC